MDKIKFKPEKLSKEEREERAYWKRIDSQNRQAVKEEKLRLRNLKINIKRELNILKFMLKHDVMYHHHKTQESSKKTIQNAIDLVIRSENYEKYDPYIWNYQGEGNNYTSISLLDCRWYSSEFATIYDVPLDGSYIFVIFDSGQRGLGSYNYIEPVEVDNNFQAPEVNPGGCPPTYFY